MIPNPIFTSTTQIRVRYAETDSMKVAYHASYLVWFEVGRNELIRELGYPYRQLEENSIFLPVIEAFCTYVKPVHYDDLLTLASGITDRHGVRLRIEYHLYRGEVLVAQGHTIHAFTDSEGRPIRPPKDFLEKLENAESR